MTGATYRNLVSFEHDINALRQIFPEAVPHDDRDRRTPLTPSGCGWEAVNDALDMLDALAFEPDADTPLAWARWLRLAALDALRAATACAGLGEEDAPRWERMTLAGLIDECYQVVHPA